MTPEEQKAYDDAMLKIKELVQENTKGFLHDKDLEVKTSAIVQKMLEGTVSKEKVEALETQLNDMGLELKAYKEQQNRIPMNFRQQLKKEFLAQKQFLNDMMLDGSKRLNLSFKEVGDMTNAASTTGSVIIPSVEAGLIWPGDVQPAIASRCNVRPTTSALIWITQKTGREGGAGVQTEGSAKSQMDFVTAGGTSTAWVAAGWVTATKQILADVNEIMAEIQGEISYQVNYKVDSIIRGGGTPTGITDVVNAFTLTNTDLATLSPNISDAIGACIAQIQSNNFAANKVFINPLDAWGMKLQKDDDGGYSIPPFLGMNGMIDGIEIVPTNMITKGNILVGDFTKAQVRILEGFNISVGYNGTDFTENKVTILGEMRLHNWVASNHYGAFVYDAISDITTAITKA